MMKIKPLKWKKDSEYYYSAYVGKEWVGTVSAEDSMDDPKSKREWIALYFDELGDDVEIKIYKSLSQAQRSVEKEVKIVIGNLISRVKGLVK